MSLPKPNLDDVTFEELVDESKKLIPIYAPDWTDFNVHDPGITFIELFAWLSEMQIYRMNQVTEKNKLKFLKLLGIKPKPANPAKVNVTFSLTENYAGPNYPQIGKKTLLAAIDSETGDDIIFEPDIGSEEQISVLPLQIVKIVTQGWDGITDCTSSNLYDSHYYHAFGTEVKESDSLYLGFDYLDENDEKDKPLEFTSKTLSLMVYLYEADLIDVGIYGDEIPEIFSEVQLKWEYWDNTWKEWKKSKNPDENQIIDETQNFTSTGLITFKGNAENVEKPFNLKRKTIAPYFESIFWIRCTVERKPLETAESTECKNNLITETGKSDILYDISPRIESIQLNTIPATQGKTIEKENFNPSDGRPNQIFNLKNTPVISESQLVSVNNKIYTEVDDFDASGPEDAHYVFKYETGEISFGDGVNGFIPPDESNIEVDYRTGGGVIGNVKENSINKIIDDNLQGIMAKNSQAASGGSEHEILDETLIRLRKDLKEPYQAVTSNDYEYIAKKTPGLRVRRAKALSYNEKNMVKVIVVPEVPKNMLPNEELSEGLIKTVYNHLCKHRLITTQIEVAGAEYVEISVKATVKIKPEYETSKVKQNVEEILQEFLHPITGGPDGNGWPFGRSVFKSEIYERIDNMESVDCVHNIQLENGKYSFDGLKIEIPENALVYSKTHNITIMSPEEECPRRGTIYG